MAEELNLLEKVKSILGITGTYQNTLIQIHIDEVKQYLLDGGVEKDIVESSTSAGVIARGVYDLYFNGALSVYFKERAIQLSYKTLEEGNEDVQA